MSSEFEHDFDDNELTVSNTQVGNGNDIWLEARDAFSYINVYLDKRDAIAIAKHFNLKESDL